MLKEQLCFDPEFWNLMTLRTHCLGLMSDKVMKAVVLSEMEEEEEKGNSEELLINARVSDSCAQGHDPGQRSVARGGKKCVAPSNIVLLKRRKWRKRLRSRNQSLSDDEADRGDDPEFKYNLKATSYGHKPVYSLRHVKANIENAAIVKAPLNRKREYLSRCVKSQILKRKGWKKRWLQGLPRLEQVQPVKEKKGKVSENKVKSKGKKRGRKPLQKMELSYPDNELCVSEEEFCFEDITDTDDREPDMPQLENELEPKSQRKENRFEQMDNLERENELEKHPDLVCSSSPIEKNPKGSQTQFSEALSEEPQAAVPSVDAGPELDGPPLKLLVCPIEVLHNYSLKFKKPDGEKPPESLAPEEVNGDTEQEAQSTEETEVLNTEVSCSSLNNVFIITGHMDNKLTCLYCALFDAFCPDSTAVDRLCGRSPFENGHSGGAL